MRKKRNIAPSYSKPKYNKMKSHLMILAALMLLGACRKNESKITNRLDYEQYLGSMEVPTSSKYFELWNSKIKPDSIQLSSFGVVAGEYQRYFKASGDIRYLQKAEQALERAVEIAAIGKAGYNRSLARNYISQHRFREALQLALTARKYGSGLKETYNLLFDIEMELGAFGNAEKYLDSIKDFSDFGYLIRLAKWNDHLGDTESAIAFMEKAAAKAESSSNKSLMLWTYTNLADYYGHAGRISDSYSYYLRSLRIDPSDAYAKKGIAWIIYSYEDNPGEALRILDSVTEYHRAPDYYLLKSQIADYMGDDKKRLINLDQYFKTIKEPGYGDMYNTYSIAFYLDQAIQYDQALRLAETEVANRPTPNSYGLLAYCYFKRGELDKALDLVNDHIAGRTEEPEILLYVAEIFKAAGKVPETRELKSKLLSSKFELGPASDHIITNL
jgi:tetratricopeptide (TPR) repeat protein